MILGNSEAIALSVAEGIGVAFLSRLVVDAPVTRGELVHIEIENFKVFQEVWMGRNIHQPATQAQAAFWNFVHEPGNSLVAELLPNSISQEKVRSPLSS
jgi:DNA-binding transcriptional LysR family regulator